MSPSSTQINLLPAEIEAKRKVRQQTFLLFILGGVVLVGLAGLFLFRNIELNREKERLEAAQAEVRTLQTKVNALDEFARLEETVKQKQATLAVAMKDDIAWSRMLVELSMIIPGDSWLTQFSGTSVAAAAPGAAPVPGQAPSTATSPTLGTINFTAVTFDFPGVAKWITRLQELKSLKTIWVPTASKAEIGTRDVINYTSTAEVTQDGGSGRYQGGTK